MTMAAIKLAVAIGVLIPLAWSALLEVARTLSQDGRRSIGAAEEAMLLLMIVPLLITACIVAVVTLAPSAGTVLPSAVRISLAQTAGSPFEDARPSPDWIGFAALGVAIFYAAGALWLLFRLLLGQLHIRWVLAGSIDASSTWGEGVLLSMAPVPAFASGRTSIVLPDALVRELSPGQTALVVQHERAHLRRGDPYRFQALALVDVIYWCNPIVRRQAERCRLAAELACDTAATCANMDLRRTYAEALVIALRQATCRRRFNATASFPPATQGDYHMRINEIMRPTQPSSERRTWAPIALGLLLAGPLTLLQADLAGAAVTRSAANSGLLLPTARLTADQIDVATSGNTTLVGHVVVQQDGLDLSADHVVLTALPSKAATAKQYDTMVAEGNVKARISEASMKMLGDKVSFTSDAVVHDGDAIILQGAKVTLSRRAG